MKKLSLIMAGAMLIAGTSTAGATFINPNSGDGANMQDILNGITYGGTSRVNAYNDYIKDGADAYWTTGGVGISSATMIVELAGLANSNSFGIYDPSNINNTAQLFAGSESNGSKVAFSFGNYGNNNNLVVANFGTGQFNYMHFNTNVFGFYFNNGVNTFYSDTSLNNDRFDHMVAYAAPSPTDSVKLPGNLSYTPWLASEYVLGFEDSYGGGDSDYNDMVLMVESVAAVPEPGTLILVGSGLLGLGLYGRRKTKKA